MTRSREMSHLSKISISIFLHQCLTTTKCFILMQTPLQLDIWLQSYAKFDNAKNNIKQRNLNLVFCYISKTTSPTSDSFLLIMSHISNSKNKYHRLQDYLPQNLKKRAEKDFCGLTIAQANIKQRYDIPLFGRDRICITGP